MEKPVVEKITGGVYSTYNIADDSIHLEMNGHRVPDEVYKYMKDQLNMRWFPARDQLVMKWTPTVEDFVTDDLGLEIADEFVPDDPESRVNRFMGYSSNAADRAESLRERSDQISERFAGGQPIMVGHHSERGARSDHKKMENAMRASISESEKSEYWARRAQGAISRANQKENPGVIYRRINGPDGIKKHIRDQERVLANSFEEWIKHTGTYNYRLGRENTPEEMRQSYDNMIAWANRWLDHLQKLLDYNQALYVASGGIAADSMEFEVGGAIYSGLWGSRVHDGWSKIYRVTKRNGSVTSVSIKSTWNGEDPETYERAFPKAIKVDEIKKVMSKQEYDHFSASGELPERYQKAE